MAEPSYTTTIKSSEDLVKGDQFKIGDILVSVTSVGKTKKTVYGNLVLYVRIIDPDINIFKMMKLLVPKDLPFTTLK